MRRLVGALFFVTSLMAGEVLDYLVVDGQRYESVKWGPANHGKVVIFHSRGVATLPIEKLPPEYQAQFGHKPESATATPDPQKNLDAVRRSRSSSPPQNTGEWAAYNRDRSVKVLLDGKLVDRSTLTTITGFLAKEQAQFSTADRTVKGAVLELARRREDTGPVNPTMELRPALWKRTGEFVWLSDYSAQAIVGALLRVYVVEDKPVDGQRVFRVGVEPSFEQWQELNRR